MKKLLAEISSSLPDVTFKEGKVFCWSPSDNSVTYCIGKDKAPLSLLHEASHAFLGHKSYSTDFELLLMEVEAWEKAKELAENYNVSVDEDYIQDRIDTYRDWLHQRSTCPRCQNVSLQSNSYTYTCHNCNASWKVSSSRFCRPYRLSKFAPNKKPPEGNKPQATFR